MADCIFSTPLTDDALLIYLDEPTDTTIGEHLRLCEACAQRARAWQKVNQKLHRSLNRLECFTPQELGEYHSQLLSPERHQALERHLNQCPHCQRELALTRKFLEANSPNEQETKRPFGEAARVFVAQLIGPSFTPAANLRGATTGPRIYQFEQYQLLLETQPSLAQPNQYQAQGTFLGVEPEGWELQFWLETELMHTLQLDELGAFLVDGLPSGQYTLVLTSPDQTIVIRIVAVDI